MTILTDEMLAAAFRYRETNLWRKLYDNDVFAFRLSDGETGYCCVMGSSGEHLALGFYRGSRGFNTYLDTIDLTNQKEHYEVLDTVATFDCINCDFANVAELRKEQKVRVRSYAKANGLKISRPKGWPEFIRYQPGRMPYVITRESDARDIVEALRAAVFVAETLKEKSKEELGFDMGDDDYATFDGGKVVPYLIPQGVGGYQWSTAALPAYQPREVVETKFANDILEHAVKRLPVGNKTWQLRLFLLPIPLTGKKEVVPCYSAVLLCLCPETENLFPIVCLDDFDEKKESVLVDLANHLCRIGSKPHTIEVEEEKSEVLLKDFCHRCGIKLARKKRLPKLRQAWEFVANNIMML